MIKFNRYQKYPNFSSKSGNSLEKKKWKDVVQTRQKIKFPGTHKFLVIFAIGACLHFRLKRQKKRIFFYFGRWGTKFVAACFASTKGDNPLWQVF